MILEHAVLIIDAGRAAEFEAAFREATPLISASAGFHRMTMSRCVETPGRYLLLVAWESVAAHNEGFRGSPAYQRWRELLHRFYDPMPLVEHYEAVVEAGIPSAVVGAGVAWNDRAQDGTARTAARTTVTEVGPTGRQAEAR